MFHVFNNSGIFAVAQRPYISGSLYLIFFFWNYTATSSAHTRMNVIKIKSFTPFSSKFDLAPGIWLCLPVTNDRAERAFSDMKRAKKDFRSSNFNLRLNAVWCLWKRHIDREDCRLCFCKANTVLKLCCIVLIYCVLESVNLQFICYFKPHSVHIQDTFRYPADLSL